MSWPKILGSAMSAKCHDPLCTFRSVWSSAQPGQLRAMTLAHDSTILGQEFEMVPGFLIPHRSCAGTVTALQQYVVCHVWTVRRLSLGVGLFLQMTWRDLYVGTLILAIAMSLTCFKQAAAQAVKGILDGGVWPVRLSGLSFLAQHIPPRARAGAAPQNCSVDKASRWAPQTLSRLQVRS